MYPAIIENKNFLFSLNCWQRSVQHGMHNTLEEGKEKEEEEKERGEEERRINILETGNK